MPDDYEIQVGLLTKLQETINLFEKEYYMDYANKLKQVAQQWVDEMFLDKKTPPQHYHEEPDEKPED